MFAHVKFPPPRNVEADVPVSDIVCAISPKDANGQRQKTPFKPQNIHDFDINQLYVLMSGEQSTDGRLHPYYCQIGAMAESREDLIKDLKCRVDERRRIRWGKVDFSLSDPESEAENIPPNDAGAAQMQRNSQKKISSFKRTGGDQRLSSILNNIPFGPGVTSLKPVQSAAKSVLQPQHQNSAPQPITQPTSAPSPCDWSRDPFSSVLPTNLVSPAVEIPPVSVVSNISNFPNTLQDALTQIARLQGQLEEERNRNQLQTSFDIFTADMSERLEGLYACFDGFHARFEGIDKKLSQFQGDIGQLTKTIDTSQASHCKFSGMQKWGLVQAWVNTLDDPVSGL